MKSLFVEPTQKPWRQRKGQERQGQRHGQREASRATDLKVPRVYLELRTLSTVGDPEMLVPAHETAEASHMLANVRDW